MKVVLLLYQFLFHFGPSLLGIYSYPPPCYAPAVRGSNTAERGRGCCSCSWVVACAAKPRRFLSFAPRRPGAGYIALSRRHGRRSTLLKSHPNGSLIFGLFGLFGLFFSFFFPALSELLRIALGAYAAFTRVKRAPRLILTGCDVRIAPHNLPGDFSTTGRDFTWTR